MLKIGTGIGAGIISNGHIHRGAQGAGDVSHIQVVDDGSVICRCGNVGCLEALAGGGALGRAGEAAALAGASPRLQTALDQHGHVTAADVARAASFGDPVAVGMLQDAGRRVGLVLASIVNFFNPSLIVVGGGVAQSGDQLLASIRETVYRRSLPLATRDLVIQRSSLGAMAGSSARRRWWSTSSSAARSMARWRQADGPSAILDAARAAEDEAALVTSVTTSTKSPESGSFRISFWRPSGRISRLMTTLPSCVSGSEPMRGVEPPRHSKSSTSSQARLSPIGSRRPSPR